MIELFSDVTFITELPSGGVAPSNEMDVTVFSDVSVFPERRSRVIVGCFVSRRSI
jgi:hypothetical protein